MACSIFVGGHLLTGQLSIQFTYAFSGGGCEAREKM